MNAMKRIPLVLSAACLLNMSWQTSLHAQRSATQHLTLEVRSITRLVVSHDPGPLVITRTSDAATRQAVSDQNTRYSILTTRENMKISASIDRQLPQGTSLKISLKSSKGVSTGDVDLSHATAPQEVVRSIGRGADRDQSITYTFAADAGVREMPTEDRLVTLTLTD